MPKKRWIWLNIPVFTWKNSTEYASILNVSDPVQSIRSLYELLSSYRDSRIQDMDTVKNLRNE